MGIKNKFSGIGVALITPFKNDKSIDFEALQRIIQNVVDADCDYIVALGTTSEAPTLSESERVQVLQAIVKTVDKKIPVVVGCGGYNTTETIKEIEKLPQEISGILSVVPFYSKPNQAGMYQHFKAIAESTTLPIILYNIPGRTGVNMEASTTVKLAKDFKNIVAIKEASGNFLQMMKILRDRPEDFAVLSGDDMYALPLISMGGDGIISVVGNAMPATFAKMIHSALDGNSAEALKTHYSLMEMFQLMFKEGNPAGIKAALENMGVCEQHLRLPLVPISNDLNTKIKEQLVIIRQNGY